MTVGEARALARRWAVEEATGTPGLLGAFTHGSSNWMAEHADLAPTSDLDVIVVVLGSETPSKPGKLPYQGVLLDVSYLSEDGLASPEAILGQSHLAGSFAASTLLLDRSGRLAELRRAVARDYARREWVHRRCEAARDRLLGYLQGVEGPALLHDRVLAWLFATGLTTHVLLVAGLKNPTVRRRYAAVKELLAEYDLSGFYPHLLERLGCASWSLERVERHLAAATAAFDAAAVVLRTPVPFAADLTPAARATELGGCRELIERGLHREAAFWVAVTLSRCQKVFHQDAPPETCDRFVPGYQRLLSNLGIATAADLARRASQLAAFLPRVWDVAETILARNPAIAD